MEGIAGSTLKSVVTKGFQMEQDYPYLLGIAVVICATCIVAVLLAMLIQEYIKSTLVPELRKLLSEYRDTLLQELFEMLNEERTILFYFLEDGSIEFTLEDAMPSYQVTRPDGTLLLTDTMNNVLYAKFPNVEAWRALDRELEDGFSIPFEYYPGHGDEIIDVPLTHEESEGDVQ